MRCCRWTLIVLLLGGCQTAAQLRPARAAPKQARSTEAPPASAGAQPRSARSPRPTARIWIDLHDVSLDQALATIGRQVGRNIVAEPGIEDRVDLTLRDVPWKVALDLVLERTHCEVQQLGEVLYVPQPPRVTLQF